MSYAYFDCALMISVRLGALPARQGDVDAASRQLKIDKAP
ncbi:hypothetical protein BH10CHL1_BH10CHL1_34100 [soil metagenome]